MIGFLKQKIGILHTHSGCGCPSSEMMKVFGKQIDFILTLMKYVTPEIFIPRAVAIGLYEAPGGKSAVAPALDIISLYGISLITVFDIGMNIGHITCGTINLLHIIRKRAAEIKRAVEIDYKHLPVGKVLLPV